MLVMQRDREAKPDADFQQSCRTPSAHPLVATARSPWAEEDDPPERLGRTAASLVAFGSSAILWIGIFAAVRGISAAVRGFMG